MASSNDLMREMVLEDKLVDLWPDYPCLYDVRSSEFKNRDRRQSAMEEIGSKLDQTVDWVKNKIRLLRNSYTKAKKPQSSGSARKNPTKRANWLLEKLQFLGPHITATETISNFDLINPSTPQSADSDGSDEEVVPEQAETIMKSSKRPTCTAGRGKSLKKRREEEEYVLIQGLAASLKQPRPVQVETQFDTFGRYVSQSLSELDLSTRHLAQHEISKVLFQAQTGTLQQQLPRPQLVPQQPGWGIHQDHRNATYTDEAQFGNSVASSYQLFVYNKLHVVTRSPLRTK